MKPLMYDPVRAHVQWTCNPTYNRFLESRLGASRNAGDDGYGINHLLKAGSDILLAFETRCAVQDDHD